MYYVNRQQIDLRLDFIPSLTEALQTIHKEWRTGDLIIDFAQERAIQLAVETVTDVGSYLIDGFLMRDASSYEDIIDILKDEKVFPEAIYGDLINLVKLRRSIVQEYFSINRGSVQPIIEVLPDTLSAFASAVRKYIKQELDGDL